MASVTILPVSRPAESERVVADPAHRSHQAPAPVHGAERSAVIHPVRPRTRTVRRHMPARRGRPRPRACDRSYEPDLHGSRLTRRGRVVVGLIWMLMAIAVIMMINRPADVTPPAVTTTVTVQSGDTLWDLTDGLAPEVDRRVVIGQIIELNGLRSAGDIHPGDVLLVPAG